MSDKKISELTSVAANASGDMFPMVQGTTTYKTTLAKISQFLQGFLPATETAKGMAEIATQNETDTGTDDARIITPLKLKNFSKWATKENILDSANTASGGNTVTLNTTSGIATFNISIASDSKSVLSVDNSNITTNSVIAYGLKYTGQGNPTIISYECLSGRINFNVANFPLTSDNNNTNANLVIWFKIIA